MGIKIGDKELQEEYGNPDPDVVILGGIEPSANMIALMKIPVKLRIFPKINRKGHNIEVETMADKERLIAMDFNEHGVEDPQQRLSRKEQEKRRRDPLQPSKREVEFSYMRVTQMQCNKQISRPGQINNKQELRIQSLKYASNLSMEQYIKEECDSNLTPTGGMNLTKAEDLGRKEIMEGIKSRIWLLYCTDKIGNLVLDTKDNFMESMFPRYESHQESNLEEVANCEKLMSNHSKCWVDLMGFGINAGAYQASRIKKAFNTVFSDLPHLDGLRKYHKKYKDRVKGPPCTPCAMGRRGPMGHKAI